jgi:two-component system, NarL family, sensor histidine kinase DesK
MKRANLIVVVPSTSMTDPAPDPQTDLGPAPTGTAPAAGRPNLRRLSWLFAGIWLFYLAQPIGEAWRLTDPVRRFGALTAIVAFAVLFVTTFAASRTLRRSGRRLAVRLSASLVSLAALLVVVLALLMGQDSLALFVYVGVMAVFLLPGRWGPVTVLVLVVATVAAHRLVPGWHVDLNAPFQIFIGGLAMFGVVQLILRNGQLAAAREEITRLAVEEERNRFARDLHDILGHSLTVVAIKAELAGRLIRLNPDRAEAEIADVEGLARQALADVRSAVAGYREVTLAAELANARSALSAAGIDAELPLAIDEVPAAQRELFGWVVREGITNVIRHSGASRCRVRVEASEVEISDDGFGSATSEPSTNGHGLVGLRERAEAVGGTLSVRRPSQGGFALMVRV